MEWLFSPSRQTLVAVVLVWSWLAVATVHGRFNSTTGQLISCLPNPCQNGGVCETDAKTQLKSCRCPESHVGQYCQHISPCYTGSDISKRCLNQGTCQVIFRGTSFVSTETPPSFQCQCRLGYSASLCEIPLATVCDRAPCQNGGTCQLNGSLNDFTCRCRPGYRGATCTEVDYCQSRPCNNSGKCRSLQSGYVCDCLAGFEGPTCTQDINECLQGQVCQHGGTCINTIGSYRCACRPGYSGQDCQSLYVPCSPNHCLNGGRCYQDKTDRYLAHCDCPPGYVGKACEINYDDCKDNQCMNGATCLDGLNNYSCQCPPTYMGVYCTEDVDECGRLPVPCKNGATCINSRGGYSCICVNGWTGKHCDQNINDCTALVCLNGGTCHDRVSSYYCDCPPGKTGFQCQLDDACASQPCKEGSLCDTNPTDGSFSCFQCRPGFNGTDCSQDINECEMASDLCAHDGVCRNTPGSFVCDCPKGLTGSRCEMNINECASNPCQNDGTCLDMRGEYRCVCMPGYTGVNCQTDIDECSSLPCQNGGVCRNIVNGFQCACVIGFTGPTCSDRVSECSLSPCQNGGICRDSRGPESFKCQCPSGFGGAFCEENLSFNQCLSAPCQAEGTCVNGVGGFTCQCRSGYSGRTCEKSDSRPASTYNPKSAYPIDEKNRLAGCPVPDCASKAKNGRCDEDCNRIECDYDNRECQKIDPWANCTRKTSAPCWNYFRNGKCDQECNIQECLFDGFDCGVVGRCEADFNGPFGPNFCVKNYGNGHCDPVCNNKQCYFDGLDCNTDDPSLLDGALIVIVNIPPEQFPMASTAFLQKLGRSLRMVAQIQKDKDGKDLIAPWPLNGGIAINSNNTIPKGSIGTAVNIQLDNRTCTMDCFQTVDAVARYLTAAEQQGTLDLGYPLYSVQTQGEAAGMVSPDKSDKSLWWLFLLVAVALIAVTAGVTTFQQKRKRISATTWFPEGFIKNASTSALNEHLTFQSSGLDYKKAAYDNRADASTLGSFYDSETELHQPSAGKRFRGASDDTPTFTQPQTDMRKPDSMFAFTPPSQDEGYGLDVNAKGPGGMTSLMLATMRGNGLDNSEDEHGIIHPDPKDEEVNHLIHDLLMNGSKLDDVSEVDGETALHLAARYGRPGVVKMLIENGADVTIKDHSGRTAIHSAVAAGASSILIVLRGHRKVDWNARTNDGTTALILVARLNIDLVDEILRHDVDINLADDSGRTALHWAASVNNYQAVKILLHRQAKVDIQDNSAETPLYLAAKEGNFEAARELVVEFHANMELPNDMDQTPREIALFNGHHDVVRLLDQQKDVVHSPPQNLSKNIYSYATQSVHLPTTHRYTTKNSARNKQVLFNTYTGAPEYQNPPKKSTGSYRRRNPLDQCQMTPLNGHQAAFDVKPSLGYMDARYDMAGYAPPPKMDLRGFASDWKPEAMNLMGQNGNYGQMPSLGAFPGKYASMPVATAGGQMPTSSPSMTFSPDSPGQWSSSPQSEWSDGTGMPSPKGLLNRISSVDHAAGQHAGMYHGQYMSTPSQEPGLPQFL